MNILVVDDDVNIIELVAIYLSQAGYTIIKATNGEEALTRMENNLAPDLAVVDVMMPGMDGFTLTQKLKERFEIPVILLTAKGQLDDKEKGFLAGSDDYVVKPFEPKELLFRIRAILKRYEKSVEQMIQAGPLQIDRQRYEVKIGHKIYLLPLKEFELLSVLSSKPGYVFQRDYLIERVWGYDYEGDEQTLNVHIKRLRDKLEEQEDFVQIVTVRGIGYKLKVNDT